MSFRAALSHVRGSGYIPSKIQYILSILQQITAQETTAKFILFSAFAPMIQTLQTALTQARIPFVTIDGSAPLDKRAKMVEAFQNPGGPSVCILSSRAGNAGLTLTAANHLIFVEPNMNIAVDAQAIGRVNRMGQLRQVTIHRLLAEGTVEERIQRLILDGTLSPHGYDKYTFTSTGERDLVLSQMKFLFQA